MCRRVSAGELEDRYNIKHRLFDFYMEMLDELIDHAEDRGMSWRQVRQTYLLRELVKHMKAGDWVATANFCFFLRDREINKEETTSKNILKEVKTELEERIAVLDMKAKPPYRAIKELKKVLEKLEEIMKETTA